MDEKDSVTAQRILGRVSSPTFYVYLSASRPAASFPDAIRASLAFHYHLSFLLCLLTVSFRLFVSMSSGNVYIISYCPPCSFSDHSRRLLVAVTAPVSLYPLLPFIWPSHTAQLVLVPLQWVQGTRSRPLGCCFSSTFLQGMSWSSRGENALHRCTPHTVILLF